MIWDVGVQGQGWIVSCVRGVEAFRSRSCGWDRGCVGLGDCGRWDRCFSMYGVKVLDRCIAVINGRNKATLVHLRLRKTILQETGKQGYI